MTPFFLSSYAIEKYRLSCNRKIPSPCHPEERSDVRISYLTFDEDIETRNFISDETEANN